MKTVMPFFIIWNMDMFIINKQKNLPLIIKPILLFYGLVHLIKACILTIDPAYPETTAVLAHGVSTRKRKKQNYHFFQDEVKFQKNGLFPFISEKLFHMKQLEGEKVIMNHLFKLLPELGPLYKQMDGSVHHIKMNKENHNTYTLSKEAADLLHMSDERFIEYGNHSLHTNLSIQNTKKQSEHYRIKLNPSLAPYHCFPLSYHLEEDTYYFPVDREILQLPLLNELMVHYVILYNLSMISRYDTEWWSELFHTDSSEELPYINQFLNTTSQKVPYLFGQWLHAKNIP